VGTISERVRARSARPGAETLVTDQQSETTKDGENDSNLQSVLK
jgi:hypothetical protein